MCVNGEANCESCAEFREPELMKRMVQALGVAGQLTETERAEAAGRCEECTDTEPCRDFLDVAEIRGAEHAPGFCRNADLFDERASETPSTI